MPLSRRLTGREDIEEAEPRAARGAKGNSPPPWLARSFARFLLLIALMPAAGAGAGFGFLLGWLDFAPPLQEFESYNPPETSVLLDRHNEQLTALYTQQRSVVSLDDVPSVLPAAFEAIEDERFRQHFGIDVPGVIRATAVNLLRTKFAQGASTITQQTARNVVERVGREKSLRRKIAEMIVALHMEYQYSKEQILEVYLNHIYLGSGTYGVEAAAQRYFGKPAGQLNIAECATLAGLPQLPESYSPLNNPEKSRERRDHVLFKLVQLGHISEKEYAEAVTSPLEVHPSRMLRTAAPYFVDAVRQRLKDHPVLGGRNLPEAGLVVRTTIEPPLQQIAQEALREGVKREQQRWLANRQRRFARHKRGEVYLTPPEPGQIRMASVHRFYKGSLIVELPGQWRADLDVPPATAEWFSKAQLDKRDGVDVEITEVLPERQLFRGRLLPERPLQGALVCLNAQSGDVRAFVGGRDFYDRSSHGFFNRALHARRQAGSTMKPFFYSSALKQGAHRYTMLEDRPLTFPDGYTPRNYDGKFLGRVTLEQALARSRNIPTINLIRRYGLSKALRHVRQFERVSPGDWALPRELAVVLGTTAVTPLELAAAYQVLANDGTGRGPRFIEGIWEAGGREKSLELEQPSSRVLNPEVSMRMTRLLQTVMKEGTGRRLLDKLPESLRGRIAGKSGTTNDYRDAWFAGYTPHEVVVVWVGFDQNLDLGPGRSGSLVAGPIWADFLAKAWQRKTPAQRQTALIPEPVKRPTKPRERAQELSGNLDL